MRGLDDGLPGAREALRRLFPRTGRAFILGITGNPGAGKSTVVDGLIAHYRKAGQRVGVVVIDPTSPFSGGAILGDRIRMQRHSTDPGVFIRSLATRGHLGGLTRSTAEIVAVLDAMGHDIVIVETVGVGQGEIDVVSQADTAVVVTVPGLGDEVQAIKAGILEIADVLVVNKADREGADRSVRDLMTMLDLRSRGSDREARRAAAIEPVEIIRTIATSGKGLDELAAAIQRHHQRMLPRTQETRRRRACRELRDALLDRLAPFLDHALIHNADLVDRVARRADDPYSAAERLFADLFARLLKPARAAPTDVTGRVPT